MNYVKMTCISITTPIISNLKLPQFYPEIGIQVFSPVVLEDNREKVLSRNLSGNAPQDTKLHSEVVNPRCSREYWLQVSLTHARLCLSLTDEIALPYLARS
jgi:hypothetical protein